MSGPILERVKLGNPPWPTVDPFLFCVHHKDAYPKGNASMGPDASLVGRNIGMDFGGKDGWSMYHGDKVPGFPRHPHRGFETVTLARRGLIDHSDSLGAKARFGRGDAQWMTAGRGIVHSEMFPLLDEGAPNPCELFQIWLNLPSEDKMVEPHFTMLWSRDIPVHNFGDDGKKTRVVAVAGELAGRRAPSPPPKSWASRADADVAIWTIQMEPGASFNIPPAKPGSNRTFYVFDGEGVTLASETVAKGTAARVVPDIELTLQNGRAASEILMLQGQPIQETVVHHGPFVMNTPDEIRQAIRDYQRTQYGGWQWTSDGPVHAREQGRFAVHADGRPEDGPPE